MFADNILIILRNQEEANVVIELLDLYTKAIEAKVNLEKSYLLTIGRVQTITILGIQIISDENRCQYEHLGIPIGIDNKLQTQQFQEDIVTKFETIRKTQSRFYLSLKGRVLIANTLIISLLRYAVRFIPIPLPIRRRLKKEYYRLIQDARQKTLEYDFYAYLLKDKGGIGCIDLQTIYEASVAITVVRVVVKPNLAQAMLIREIILEYSTGNVLKEAVYSPYIQSFSLSIRYVPNYTYEQQTTQVGMYNLYKAEESEVVTILKPINRADVLALNPQYYLLIRKIEGSGAKRQNSIGQRGIQERGVRIIEDVLDSTILLLRIPQGYVTKAEKDNTRSRINTLLLSLPDRQLDALNEALEGGRLA